MKKQTMTEKRVSIGCDNRILRGCLLWPKENRDEENLILILHGLMDSIEFPLIKKQAHRYAQAGYPVLMMDFHGHGKSDGKLTDMTISEEIIDAKAICSFIEACRSGVGVYLIGHSQGGIIASALAAQIPERLRGLVLIAPAGMLGEEIQRGRILGVSFDPCDPPETVEVFGESLGRNYLLDLAATDLYGFCEEIEDRDILILEAENDELLPSESLDRYVTGYTQSGNRVKRTVIKGADHEFSGFENKVSEEILAFFDETKKRGKV